MDESTIIDCFFRDLGATRPDVVLGVGDDAAVLLPPTGMQLVSTTDTLVESTHFLPGASPRSLGHRALAINLSDCAAMGATPAWAMLALTMPRAEERWLGEFAAGLGALLHMHHVALVGGNLARGPLAITVQLTGFVPSGAALCRGTAAAGDVLMVSGTLGDAAAGLDVLRGRLSGPGTAELRKRFEYPEARVALGGGLRGVASACMDISDGLHVDLQRLLAASDLAATLDLESLPVSAALQQTAGDAAWRYALQGGEDFELLCTVPPGLVSRAQELAARCQVPLTPLATLCACPGATATPRLQLHHRGNLIPVPAADWDHFQR